MTFTSRTDAQQYARQQVARGVAVKVYRRSGVYTQPGRGVVAFVNYDVRPA